MKNLSFKQKTYQLKRNEKRIERTIKRIKKQARKLQYFEPRTYQIKSIKNKIRKAIRRIKNPTAEKRIMIDAPEVFSLIDSHDRERLLFFIKNIKTHLHNGRKIYLIFDKTKILHPCGTLFAVSNIESILALYPKTINCNYPKNDVVEQLFQHIGFLNLLGKRDSRKKITAENVRYWHYVNGVSTDDVSKFKDLLKSINLDEDIESGLFEGMSEAVTNTIQHAYDNNEQKMWWMFAQKKESLFQIAICDLGMGIPASLRKKPEIMEFIASPVHHVKNRRDTSLIEIAVDSSRSSTRLAHRGNGLKDMLDFAKTNNIGGFRIFSAKGAFSYQASNHQEYRTDYRDEIRGTIVQWQIPLDSKNEQ